LEFLSEDGRLYNRFKIDRANGRLGSVVGQGVRAMWASICCLNIDLAAAL
jgi:hypothetical protein